MKRLTAILATIVGLSLSPLSAVGQMSATIVGDVAYIPPLQYVKNVWHHQGTVLTSSTGHKPQQPSVIYESNCQIVSSPCFKMWYNNWDGSHAQLWYAESTNGTTWSNYVSNPVIANRGFARVRKNGSTYYVFCNDGGAGWGTGIDVYTSSDGITWSLAQAVAIAAGGVGAWDHVLTQLNVVDVLNGVWYGYYAGQPTLTSAWAMGLATSTDGVHWTKEPSNPVITANGPSNFSWMKVNNFYFGWSQTVLPNIPGNTGVNSSIYPSDIQRFWSLSARGPFNVMPTTTFYRTQASEGAQTGTGVLAGQVADPSMVSDGTNLWMFFTQSPSGDAVAGPWTIGAAEAPNTTFAQLVTGYEGVRNYPIISPVGLVQSLAVLGSDDFHGTNANPIGGNWTTAGGAHDIQRVSNTAEGTFIGNCEAFWNAATFSNDQWARVVVGPLTNTNSYIGVDLRVASGSTNAYRIYWGVAGGQTGGSAQYIQIEKVVNGTYTNITTGNQGLSEKVYVGDTITAVAIGTNIFVYLNGFLVGQGIDASLASGKPGIQVSPEGSFTTNAVATGWSGGNVLSGVTAP